MTKGKKSHFKEKFRWIFDHILAIIAVVVVVAVFGGAYYLVIAPNLILKPYIEKPALPEDALEKINGGEDIIKEGHINYIMNELGAYKLHKTFGTNNLPIVEVVFKDVDKRYYSYVKDNMPVTKEGNAKGEDIVIEIDQETAYNILESNSPLATIKESVNNGDIDTELVADMKTLAMKGYLSLYEVSK